MCSGDMSLDASVSLFEEIEKCLNDKAVAHTDSGVIALF